MGQIQSAINAGIGSIIASKGLAEHLQNQTLDAVESQYAEAEKIGKTAEKIANDLREQANKKKAAEDFIKQSQEKLEIKYPRDEKSGQFVNKKEYQRKLNMDIDKAKKSLEEVAKQQRASTAQAQAFNARLDMYNSRHDLIDKNLKRIPINKRPDQVNLAKVTTQEQFDAIDLITDTVKEDDLNRMNQAYKNNEENKK